MERPIAGGMLLRGLKRTIGRLAAALLAFVLAASFGALAQGQDSGNAIADTLFNERLQHVGAQLGLADDLLKKLQTETKATQSAGGAPGGSGDTFTITVDKDQDRSRQPTPAPKPVLLPPPVAMKYRTAIEDTNIRLDTARAGFKQAQEMFRESKAQETAQPAWAASLRRQALERLRDSERLIEDAGGSLYTADSLTGSRFNKSFVVEPASGSARSGNAGFVCDLACQQLQTITGQKIGSANADQALIHPQVRLFDPVYDNNHRAPAPMDLAPRKDTLLQGNLNPSANTPSTPQAAPQVQAAPPPAMQSADLRGYDARQGVVISASGEKVDIKPLLEAVRKVDPRAAQNPVVKVESPVPGIPSVERFSPDFLRAVVNDRDQLRRVGGVALDVTFNNLAYADVPDMRVPGPAALIENPIMVSLTELYRRVEPYSHGNWQNLPEHLRYPADLGRLYGFVLSPNRQDVFMVGTTAANPQDRIDIDTVSIALAAVWKNGLVPGVSLDPLPDNLGGPQYPRVINVPRDSVIARIMLDADYEMKQIMFGLRRVADANFRSAPQVIMEARDYGERQTRFWFYPTPLQPNTIHVSGTGRSVLFQSDLEVLTEDTLVQHGQIAGTGGAAATSRRMASLFTAAFPRFEASDLPQPKGIYRRLHGITDVVTMSKLLRTMGVDYPILISFSELPYRRLVGPEAIPAYYKGLVVHFPGPNGSEGYLSGGIDMRSRATRNSFDVYQDIVVTRLERAADERLSDGSYSRRISLTLTVAGQDAKSDTATQPLVVNALHAFDSGDYVAAAQAYRQVIEQRPFDVDAWVNLALSESYLGQHDAAQRAIRRAQALDPVDLAVRTASLDVARRADPALDIGAEPSEIVKGLSDDYTMRANAAMLASRTDEALRFSEEALRLSNQNGDAHLVRFLIFNNRGDTQRARSEIIKAIRLFRQQLRQRELVDTARPRLAMALTLSAMLRVNRLNALMAASGGMIEFNSTVDDLRRAAEETDEAFRLDHGLGLAICAQVMVRAARIALMHARPDFTRNGIALYDPAPTKKLADDAVAQFPDLAIAYVARSIFYIGVDDAKTAERDLTKAISLDSTLAEAFLTRASLRSMLGDCRAAAEDLRQAVALGATVDRTREFTQCSSAPR